MHGSAFDEEERSTDSEIDNVLGGIKSVPPKPLDVPVIAAAVAATAPRSPEPPSVPQVPPVDSSAPHKNEQSPIEPRLVTQSPPMAAATEAVDPSQARRDRAHLGRRKRQVIVLTAVCGFGAIVLALAAVQHVARDRAAREDTDTQRAAAQAPTAPPTGSSLTPAPAVDGLTPAAPAAASNGVTAQTPAAAPKANAASRRPASKRAARPASN
jgi:hypothetical protein